jgi:hypothetical protein
LCSPRATSTRRSTEDHALCCVSALSVARVCVRVSVRVCLPVQMPRHASLLAVRLSLSVCGALCVRAVVSASLPSCLLLPAVPTVCVCVSVPCLWHNASRAHVRVRKFVETFQTASHTGAAANAAAAQCVAPRGLHACVAAARDARGLPRVTCRGCCKAPHPPSCNMLVCGT